MTLIPYKWAKTDFGRLDGLSEVRRHPARFFPVNRFRTGTKMQDRICRSEGKMGQSHPNMLGGSGEG
jgi:hypothetical protein